MQSNDTRTAPGFPHDMASSFMYDKSLMAKKSLNMIEKMMDPNIIDYYIINCAIPSKIVTKSILASLVHTLFKQSIVE